MSSRSMLNRIRRPLIGALATAALAVGSLVAATPAQAASVDGPWQMVKATTTPAGPGTQALCQTPFRYYNAASWNCTVFSSEHIVAYIDCDYLRYFSPQIFEGSWFILGICPAGTRRTDEGIFDY
jgi:hypothetical protein